MKEDLTNSKALIIPSRHPSTEKGVRQDNPSDAAGPGHQCPLLEPPADAVPRRRQGLPLLPAGVVRSGVPAADHRPGHQHAPDCREDSRPQIPTFGSPGILPN